MVSAMQMTDKVMAGGAFLVAVWVTAAAGGTEGFPAMAPLLEKSTTPPSYTFQMDVAMAMLHFPWFRFHMKGAGEYQPGRSYFVHFNKLPWFAPRQQHDVDLSMLDPAMWPKRFIYEEIGQQDGDTLYALRAIDDPTLEGATVALGPYCHARRVDATYTDGTHIQMNVNLSNVDGFLLPVTLTADIQEPHLALSANADFEDYAFNSDLQAHSTSR
jgi:hypothetical protein